MLLAEIISTIFLFIDNLNSIDYELLIRITFADGENATYSVSYDEDFEVYTIDLITSHRKNIGYLDLQDEDDYFTESIIEAFNFLQIDSKTHRRGVEVKFRVIRK